MGSILGSAMGIMGGVAGAAGAISGEVQARTQAADKAQTALRGTAIDAIEKDWNKQNEASVAKGQPAVAPTSMEDEFNRVKGDIKAEKQLNNTIHKAAKELPEYGDTYKSNYNELRKDIYKGNFDAPTFMMANALAKQEQDDRNMQIEMYKARMAAKGDYNTLAANNAIRVYQANEAEKRKTSKSRADDQKDVISHRNKIKAGK